MRSIRFLAAAALAAVGAIPFAAFTTAPATQAAVPPPVVQAATPQVTGMQYYVDCSRPADGIGTQAAPWNNLADISAHTFAPGDQLLFNRGTACSGRIQLHGSGTTGSPISVDAYGTGALPQLIGDGTWATVTITNEQGWDIADLDISNTGPTITQTDPSQIAEQDRRRGIYVQLTDYGTGSYYHFHNLYIHDVNGPRGWDNTSTGAVYFQVTGTTTPTHFNDILVSDSTFQNDSAFGVTHWTTWRDRPEMPHGTSPAPSTGPWQPATSMIIRNNVLKDMPSDGISTHNSVGSVMEHNVVENYFTNAVGYHVPVWSWNADNALIQYNEVYGGQGTMDGLSFDLDGGDNNQAIQYNYSHDNKGGFQLICAAGTSANNVVRYNISQNNGDRLFQIVCGTEQNNQIYNNVFYEKTPALTPLNVIDNENNSNASNARFYNNVFDIDPSLGSSVGYVNATTLAWNSNTFFGDHPAGEPSDPRKLTGDPGFVSAGNGPDGYKLAPGSTSLSSGVPVPNNGGHDYWGNPVPASCDPDRGAIQVTTNPTCSADLAIAGTASQSSTFSGGGSADRAIDGDTDGNYGDGSVSHTGMSPIDANPWWQVDLGATKSVGTVRISNRTDCCSSRLSNFYIFASAAPFTSNDPNATKSQSGVWSSYQSGQPANPLVLPVGVAARYVRIQLVGNANPLALAEVEVFGNQAIGGTATADSQCRASEAAANAIDANPGDKWCGEGNGGIHQLTVQLPKLDTVSSFTVRHAGSAGEPANLDTRDFTISTTTDPACSTGWTTQVTVTGNTSNITTHPITPTQAACVRLNTTVPSVNDPAQDARIYELEVG